MVADSILEALNPEQRRAVETTEGPLLVLAGAGSGKTRVLTSRIAYLIGVCGIPAESLLAVTFTNKAAGEMRDRVEKMLGPTPGGLWISTFHSMCVRILRRDIGALERSRGFVIYDDADSLGISKQVLKRHGLDPRQYEPKKLRWRIDEWKNQGLLPAQAAAQASDIDDELTAELYATYQRLLFDANALDFGDLLLQTRELFRQAPRVLAYYQRRWQYILVDEYQDTNRVQYDLVKQLTGTQENLCVVGDPDQSVYAWRGADIRNILDFERDYANAKVIKLEQNYRSTQPILSSATAVVENNIGRKKKSLFTDREGGELVRFFEAENDREEAAYVVGHILQGTSSEGRSLGDYAILYRTNAQSRCFEEELLKYDLPYVVVGGVRFYERAEIKDVLCYLRLLVNPEDAQALRRIVNKPTRGIGKTTLERAEALAIEREVSLREGLRLFAEAGAAKRTATRLNEFLDMLGELQHFAERPVDESLSKVLERSGYMKALVMQENPDAEVRIDNLRELISSAEDFHAANAEVQDDERSELELYLDQVALISDLDAYEHKPQSVSLMTAHSAKGLEYGSVFLVGMEEGVFPHASSSYDDEGLEEERRLCYVGMTRAMEQLFMTCARERRRFGSSSFQSPSRFLREVPEELMDVQTSPAAARRARSSSPRRRAGDSGRLDSSYSQETYDDGIQPGMRVRHSVFGLGSIDAVIGEGLDQKLKIRFDRAGIKTVMVRYANLEPA
ncbi:MAG: UvrD-helicase domain-containing protein [Myxococcota bacterium]|nr:UvrD-helicase domain-containing protein [Myxococcota bacterium]